MTTSEWNTDLTEMLGMKYPIIMAPMFLVSNVAMVKEAAKAGIAGCIPALNYRTDKDFREALDDLVKSNARPFGINLIANKSNIRLEEQLKTCVEYKVDFIITSLGNPKEIIRQSHQNGIKVFCDVVDIEYAKKVESLGADAVIAVNKEAGGHAGPTPAVILVPLLRKECKIPVISAGGVGDRKSLQEKLDLGACGVSVGSPFIATLEAPVSQEYKQACVDYTEQDIIMTTKLSGSPCTIIRTPYVQSIGTQQNWLEKILNKNKTLKKYFKMLTFYKGMKGLEKAAFSATYKTLWCAGPSISFTKEILPVAKVVENLVKDAR